MRRRRPVRIFSPLPLSTGRGEPDVIKETFMPGRTFFELHIRPMSREMDRLNMRQQGSQPDLWDVNVVKAKAKKILRFLESKTDETIMPPLAFGGPWPEE